MLCGSEVIITIAKTLMYFICNMILDVGGAFICRIISLRI
jgi:hypothetical protein